MRFPDLSAVLFPVMVFLATGAEGGEIRVAGSDLLDAALRTELERFAAKADVQVAVEMKGSRPGLEALENRRADIALLVFRDGDARPGPRFGQAVIGYLTAMVVVPADLPLRRIDYRLLAGVFGVREQGNHRRWGEVGVDGAWGPRVISAMALRPAAGLSLDLFRHNVLRHPELKPTVALLDAPEEIYARLEGEEGGIAILPVAPPPASKLKVLPLAKGPDDVAYPPTAENLHTGDYPLRLPVYLVFRKGEALRPGPGLVLRHLLADETEPVLQAAGVTRIPPRARDELAANLESM